MCKSAVLSLEGAVAHAARGRDGRQEGRECGYYYLHRDLNYSLLHHTPPFYSHDTKGSGTCVSLTKKYAKTFETFETLEASIIKEGDSRDSPSFVKEIDSDASFV